jgi:uncharacterized protein YeaC (DUF1315 family)
MIENITPDIYESLKLAVEIGKWSDGANSPPSSASCRCKR